MLPTPTHFRPASLVGTTLDGRYRLTSHLASGGMGAIFRAEHVYMRKELAIKVLRPDLSTLPDIAERFRREAEIAAGLEHEHIVRVTDFGRSPEGWLFLVMELLEGESLFERLRVGPLAPEPAVRLLVQVCKGLEAAHARGVVHRDLKPENIFLTRPHDQVKLLDFGIAKLTDPQVVSDTQAGVVVGTPEYLSPEQAAGAAVDGRADLYAVGLIAWRALAGFHPFHAADARGLLMMQATRPVPPLLEARPELVAWPGLLDAVARACAKEPSLRHASAAELRAQLEEALEPAPTPSRLAALAAARRATPAPAATPGAAEELAAADVESTLTLLPDAPAATLPGPPLLRRVLAVARAHALAISLLVAAGAVAVPAALRIERWLQERPARQARALLAEDHPEAARALLAEAVQRRPTDARLRVLHGRALHRLPGEAAAGLDAYAAALELDPRALDAAALADVAGDLSRERKVAERAAALLVRAGARAVPAVLAATHAESAPARLRALEVARELGAEGRVDALGLYTALLREEDCDLRRAAARRLGDLGNPAAAPALTQLARATRKTKGLFGLPQQVPVCGAAEADAALKRLKP